MDRAIFFFIFMLETRRELWKVVDHKLAEVRFHDFFFQMLGHDIHYLLMHCIKNSKACSIGACIYM